MNKNNILVGLGIGLALIFSIIGLTKHSSPTFGGTSPDFASAYISWGGINHWTYKQTMRQASTTLCDIQSPNATTTLSRATVNFTGTPSYTTTYELGQSVNAFATTTALVASYGVPAGTTPVFVSTSTVTALVPDGIIPPNTYVNLNISTSSASATFAPTGFCEAEFTEVQ